MPNKSFGPDNDRFVLSRIRPTRSCAKSENRIENCQSNCDPIVTFIRFHENSDKKP